MSEAKMDRFWRWYVQVSLNGRHIWLRTLSTADDGAVFQGHLADE